MEQHPRHWFTNHGGIAYSDDHGQTWKKDPHAQWDNIFGLSNFQVSAMAPRGAWSEPTPLVSVTEYPELYGGFIHPWSTGEDLYFTISTWSDYNVFLMRAELN